MIRFVKPPFDPPKPNDLAGQLAEAIRIAAADLASKKETELGHVITGCDGFPVVTIGDGTTCHDGAKANSGGALALTANLGGCRAVINANLGRAQSMNSGYQGTGLSSGAIPPAMDAGAADVSLDPIDSTLAVAINAGDSADPLSAMVGATIAGKAGSGRFSVYGIDTYLSKLYYWADITQPDAPVEVTVTGTKLAWIAQLTDTRAVAWDYWTATLWFFESGVETGSYHVTEFTAFMTNPEANGGINYCALQEGGDAIILSGTQYGPSNVHHAVAYVTGLLTGSCTVKTASIRGANAWSYPVVCLAADGTAYIDAYNYNDLTMTGLLMHTMYRWDPPHTADPVVVGIFNTGTTTWFLEIAVSADGDYIVAFDASESTPFPAKLWTKSRDEWTSIQVPVDRVNSGAALFDAIGNLWLLARDIAYSYYLERYLPPYTSLPADEITLGSASHAPLAISGDEYMILACGNDDDPPGLRYVSGPLVTGASAVDVAGPGSPGDYGIAFVAAAPRWLFPPAAGLTLDCTVTSTTGSGSAVTVVTRLSYANTSGTAAFGVIIEMTLPDGSTFTSATDDGLYDSEAGIIRWLIPSVAASATGYVEVTTSVG